MVVEVGQSGENSNHTADAENNAADLLALARFELDTYYLLTKSLGDSVCL